jgi:transposase InsO family protein|tara:strand:- start:73 stop:1056 length:984 start_codon:yes stop_codon:yes gene_type:complete
MRYSQSEKVEIIRLVEQSPLSVKQTLIELDINRSTFYKWYRRYQEGGYEALANRFLPPKQFWNEIPPWERQRVVEIALEHPEKSPRELAWYITDNQGYYISESTVYRILKAHDLVTSPVYTVVSALNKFPQPTRAPNELWQTDFTWFKVAHWGWYYLCTILDDYSRYILACQLCIGMSAEEVKQTIETAIQFTGIRNPKVMSRPRLLSDNGPCYLSKALREYLEEEGILHTRCKPYHPMTQGKIERYHRSMKNILLLENYYSPDELENQIGLFVDYYNNHRYHEALNNLTPADVYYRKGHEILTKRQQTKKRTMLLRRKYNFHLKVA